MSHQHPHYDIRFTITQKPLNSLFAIRFSHGVHNNSKSAEWLRILCAKVFINLRKSVHTKQQWILYAWCHRHDVVIHTYTASNNAFDVIINDKCLFICLAIWLLLTPTVKFTIIIIIYLLTVVSKAFGIINCYSLSTTWIFSIL